MVIGALAHAGQGRDALHARVVVGELGIDLVGDDDQVVLDRQRAELLDLRRRDDHARRVRRVDEAQDARVRREHLLDALGGEREAVLLVGRHGDDPAVGEFHRLMVGVVARRGDDDLVAGVHQRQHRHEHRLLRARRDDDLVGGVGAAAFRRDRLGDRLAQLRHAERVGVVRGTLGQRLAPGLHDMGRRVEVRIAAPERDDVGEPRRDVEHPRADGRLLDLDAIGEAGGSGCCGHGCTHHLRSTDRGSRTWLSRSPSRFTAMTTRNRARPGKIIVQGA